MPACLNRPATIQWDFTDAEPWHLHIDNGNTSVAPGRVPHPDLTFRAQFNDWIDLTAGESDRGARSRWARSARVGSCGCCFGPARCYVAG